MKARRRSIDVAFIVAGALLWLAGWAFWYALSGQPIAVAFCLIHGAAVVVAVVRAGG